MVDNKIVYIGKGVIRSRYNETGRSDWQFDLIQFSVIKDEQEQFKWESCWNNKFKQSNFDQLPLHDKISGRDIADV